MTVQLKYFKLAIPVAARGGALRFFMLLHNIPFEDVTVQQADWPEEKRRMKDSGENPCGTLPVLNPNSDTPLIQHVAIMRFLATEHKLISHDTFGNYVQDLVADEYQLWRDEWVKAAFAKDQETKVVYKTDTLPEKLTMFESLYAKYKLVKESPYLSTSPSGQGLWGDTVVFSILYDNVVTKLMEESMLEQYPNLSLLYSTFAGNEKVAGWISS